MKFLTHVIFGLFYVQTEAWNISEQLQENVACVGYKLSASCRADQLLIVESARYGYMKNGTCGVPYNSPYPGGCSNVVTSLIENNCTAGSSCVYPPGGSANLPSSELTTSNINCKNATILYLDLQYRCVQDSLPESCVIEGSDLSGFISPDGQRCSNRPIEIQARDGQTIQLEMLDPLANGKPSPDKCEPYLTVTEPGRGQHAVCGQSARISVVYTSATNALSISLPPATTRRVKFVLQYTILGCLTYAVPEGARVVSQTRDVITVHCNQGNTEWTLNCENNRWTGGGHPCDEGLAIALVVAGASVVIVLIIVITTVCLIRKRLATVLPARQADLSPELDQMSPAMYRDINTCSYSLATRPTSGTYSTVKDIADPDPPPFPSKEWGEALYLGGEVDPALLPHPRQSMLQPGNRGTNISDLSLPPFPDEETAIG